MIECVRTMAKKKESIKPKKEKEEKTKLELEVTCQIFGNVTKDATVYLFAKGTDGAQSGDILHQAVLELGVDYEVADVCKLWNLQRKASAPSKMMI